MRAAVIVGLMVLGSVPAFGGQDSPNPKSTAGFGALRSAPPKDPYGRLFVGSPGTTGAIAAPPKTQSPPTIVCGMLIVPADPSIDPKFAVPPNKTPGVEFKIRAIDPPVCNPAK